MTRSLSSSVPRHEEQWFIANNIKANPEAPIIEPLIAALTTVFEYVLQKSVHGGAGVGSEQKEESQSDLVEMFPCSIIFVEKK